jgi:putative alpha-1,2-mannosidase
MGSLSSWFALSSMGIYAVTPGLPIYNIGSPLFGKVVLNLGGDKRFVIEAKQSSTMNKYIQSAALNGVPFNRSWISHEEIRQGGSLVFEMGPEPNKKWGILAPPATVMQ